VPEQPKIVIIGGRPTGLGAAWRLNELGHTDWTLVDRADQPGGLSMSTIDDKGFVWDLGGHVLFSHYEYFDKVCNECLGDQWVEHIREAWCWMRDRWIPYPFQNNIWRLPEEDLIKCIDGVLDLHGKQGALPKPTNFKEWLGNLFGPGLCDVFMYPYNYKVWAYTPDKMNVEWMGERVATIDAKRILRNVVKQQDDVSWGPNATFRFPLHGGTGAIWKACADRLPAERLQLGRDVVSINTQTRTVRFADGETISYDFLVSTMPLDKLLECVDDQPELSAHAPKFVHSSSHIIGVGFDGPVPDQLKTKCWMYFPEDNCPFYRVTVFSDYSPNNVPKPGEQWSLMAEVSESPDKPVDNDKVLAQTIEGFRNTKLLPEGTDIVSTWHRRLEHGYPTPWKGRDDVLNAVQPELQKLGIWSRGRFGGWKYEVSNQDHSLMQGVEAVDHILFGTDETTYFHPGVVNAKKNTGRRCLLAEKPEAV